MNFEKTTIEKFIEEMDKKTEFFGKNAFHKFGRHTEYLCFIVSNTENGKRFLIPYPPKTFATLTFEEIRLDILALSQHEFAAFLHCYATKKHELWIWGEVYMKQTQYELIFRQSDRDTSELSIQSEIRASYATAYQSLRAAVNTFPWINQEVSEDNITMIGFPSEGYFCKRNTPRRAAIWKNHLKMKRYEHMFKK
jgi:hypothetical protein